MRRTATASGRWPPGTLLTARAVGMIATAGLAVYLLRRTGYRWPIAVGFTLIAVAWSHGAQPARALALRLAGVAAGICGIGMGVSTPSSNNATLQLAPDHAAAVAGLRGMFRQAGSITAVSVTAAIVARSTDPGMTQAHVFLAFAAITACSLPFILLVPEHRGRW